MVSTLVVQQTHTPPATATIERPDEIWRLFQTSVALRSCVQYSSLFQLSAVVDGVYSEHSHTAGTFTMLSSSRVYVGGSLNTHALPGSKIHSNFVGCLRKVHLTFLHHPDQQ
uniref:Laminin G domain-containing protein n=1 Tax=Timema genevievae TaxID=629358 RepID=A0A7R9JRQ6_TIMGE|nr:unnamed protein product [Timema genevievae]